MSTRYTGDLDSLRADPRFDWSAELMDAYLRELDLRGADQLAEKARQLEADGAPHLEVMLTLAGTEDAAAGHPDDQREHSAATDAYAARHGLRGWHRYRDDRGRLCVQVNYLRTAADGDTGRYYVHTPHGGGAFRDGSRAWVVDRDTGDTAARFGAGESAETARAKANSWIHQAESGGC